MRKFELTQKIKLSTWRNNHGEYEAVSRFCIVSWGTYRKIIMPHESVFVLNELEKEIAKAVFQKLASGSISSREETNQTNDIHSVISYEYRSTKGEKIIHGLMLGCRYRLRYRDNRRVFFSAWDCKDVCSLFYDLLTIIHVMNKLDLKFIDIHREFEVDLNSKEYVFCTGEIALSFVKIIEYLATPDGGKLSYNSQYILSIFDESGGGTYTGLLEKLKADGYSRIHILQIWIRGEILYYAMADGAMLRPEHQRSLTSKEEQDLIRKIHKAANKLSRPVDFNKPAL
jgi:hypothetical protein